MNEEEKKAKQKAFLDGYLAMVEYTREHGVGVLRYCCCPEADWLDGELEKYQQFFSSEDFPSKKELKKAIDGLDEATFYGMHLYNQCLLSDDLKVNPEFAPRVSQAEMDYKNKLAKSLEAKQKKAPGFDGQGGGMGRRSD